MQIDLNADLGELNGDHGRQLDREIMASVTSCNIACGGHAGDKYTMEETVKGALDAKVLIGAHPAFPDRENFGRLDMDMTRVDLAASLEKQVGGLVDITSALGGEVTHLKPHGALYNRAMNDPALSELICKTAQAFDIQCIFGLPNSQTQSICEVEGLRFIGEGFADRSYEPSGALTSRSIDGAVHHDDEIILQQAQRLAFGELFDARDGSSIQLNVETLCLHGDTKGAAELSKRINQRLKEAGISVTNYLTPPS